MGSGGGGTTKGSTENTIAPELRPLYQNTGDLITNLQPQIAGQYGDFFSSNPQQIPGFTPEQQQLAGMQMGRATGNPYSAYEMQAANMAGGFGNATAPEQAALAQIGQLQNTPFGTLPTTQAAIAAARNPALNDLAMAGLGNSSAVGSSLAGAYAPIYAQEMAFRQGAVPQLAQMGQAMGARGVQGAGLLSQIGGTGQQRASDLITQAAASQEAQRALQETQGQANLADFLRRQGLGTQFTTGILSGMPTITGQTTSSRTSAGGSHLCSVVYCQGNMTEAMWEADTVFGLCIDPFVYAGYSLWAKPLAKAMDKSPRLSKLLTPFILSWGKEMQHRVTRREKGSIFGKIALLIGVPICYTLGVAYGCRQTRFSR
jgi:hypothetical protein